MTKRGIVFGALVVAACGGTEPVLTDVTITRGDPASMWMDLTITGEGSPTSARPSRTS